MDSKKTIVKTSKMPTAVEMNRTKMLSDETSGWDGWLSGKGDLTLSHNPSSSPRTWWKERTDYHKVVLWPPWTSQHVCAHIYTQRDINKANVMNKTKKRKPLKNALWWFKKNHLQLHQSGSIVFSEKHGFKNYLHMFCFDLIFETGSQNVASGSQLLRLQACPTMPSLRS